MATPQRMALVTGANRGIGREIARQLAQRGLHVILTARDATQAETAAAEIRASHLPVVAHQLDVTDPASVARLAADVPRLDVLVNNAGAYYDWEQEAGAADLAIAQAALEVHLLGPWRMCQAFIPGMRQRRYGRIVNLSSGAGSFAETDGGGTPAYSVAKAAQNMLTLKLALELRGTGVLVNAACPGWVRTDMGGPDAPRSVEQGADTPVWLATLPDDGPTGGFFRDRQPIAW